MQESKQFERSGRKYRSINQQCQVKDWETFKATWKPTDFIKSWKGLPKHQVKAKVSECLNELIQDKQKYCYLFSDSLFDNYREDLIEEVDQHFMSDLEWNHEAMYLGKKKQLLIYKKNSSLGYYLSKYRIPHEYKDAKEKMVQILKDRELMVIERNRVISQQIAEQIQKTTVRLNQFWEKEVDYKFRQFISILDQMLEQFKSQQKKYEMILPEIKGLLAKEVKQLVKKHDLFSTQRSGYSDLLITKVSLDYSDDQSIDDGGDESFENEQGDFEEEFQQNIEQKRIPKMNPKEIEKVIVTEISNLGALCKISIPSFGTNNKTDFLTAELLEPRETEEQQNFKIEVPVSPNNLEYQIVLPALTNGIHSFAIRGVNEFGKSLPEVVRIYLWQGENPDKPLFLLGENDEGLIPNWQPQNQQIIISSNEEWCLMKQGCWDFSLSSHAVICNRKGDVASWGLMYLYDSDGKNEVKKVDQEQAAPKEQQVEPKTLGFINPQCFQEEKPSLVLSQHFIRKVSCGEGYCLMADCLGRVWSFGANSLGQLGLGHNDPEMDTSEPELVEFFTKEQVFVQNVFASCFGGSFALSNKGVAYRWGTNQVFETESPIQDNQGNIINYHYEDYKQVQPNPIVISKNQLTEKVVSIHPGKQFVLVLTDNKCVYGWGRYQMLTRKGLQYGNTKNIYAICNPVPILKQISKIAVGNQHWIALGEDQTLSGWGIPSHYGKNGDSILQQAQIICKGFKGNFQCGPDYTVLYEHTDKNEMEVLGKRQIFKKGKYPLPAIPSMVKAGKGVIGVMGAK